jgi:hypothetical protein
MHISTLFILVSLSISSCFAAPLYKRNGIKTKCPHRHPQSDVLSAGQMSPAIEPSMPELSSSLPASQQAPTAIYGPSMPALSSALPVPPAAYGPPYNGPSATQLASAQLPAVKEAPSVPTPCATETPEPTPAPKTEVLSTDVSLPNENLIMNPSFEEGALCEDGKSWCVVEQDTVPGWEATGGKIELDKSVWPAYEGKVSIDLAPYADSYVHQVVKLCVGTKYELTFSLSMNKCGNGKGYYNIAPEDQDITDTSGMVEFTGFSEWHVIKRKFTATSETTRLGFGSLSGSSCGPVIDNIIVVRDEFDEVMQSKI